MTKRIVAALLLLVTGTACDIGPLEGPRHFDEYRRYTHAFFDSQEECLAAQPPDLFVNCTQEAKFFPMVEPSSW